MKPKNKTERRARDLDYKHKQRAADAAFLLTQGFDAKKLGAFVTAWRQGKIKVTFEIVEEMQNTEMRNDELRT